MRITLNGEPRETAADATVADLLAELEAGDQVAVEVNEALVPRAQHATHALAENDQVEVVRLVGGG